MVGSGHEIAAEELLSMICSLFCYSIKSIIHQTVRTFFVPLSNSSVCSSLNFGQRISSVLAIFTYNEKGILKLNLHRWLEIRHSFDRIILRTDIENTISGGIVQNFSRPP